MSQSVSGSDERKYSASLLSMILGDDTGSRLFWSLVDPAKAEIASTHYEYMDGTGAMSTYICCNKDNSSEVLKIIESELQSLYENGITEEELTKAKNKVLSTVTLKNELPMGRLIEVGYNWTYLRKYKTIEEEVASLKAVTVESINDLIREFDIRKQSRFILRPSK